MQGSLFASDIEMYLGICLREVTSIRKRYITKTSRVIDCSDPNNEHVEQLTQALTYPSAPTHS